MPEQEIKKEKGRAKEISPVLFGWLKKELTEWQKEGILEPGPAGRILGRYRLPGEKEEEDLQKRVIKYILGIGAVLIAAGVFSFVAANWKAVPDFFKILIVVAAMAAGYIAGWGIEQKTGHKKLGRALVVLGCLIYGAGIFLTAQIFHIRATWADGFILWMLGALAVGWALNSLSLYALAVPLAVVALVGHPFEIFQHFLGVDRFLLTSSFLLLLAAAATFACGFLIKKKLKLNV